VVLRPSLYSHFSESLSGLTTIRAYGESARFSLENTRRVDVEKRYFFPGYTYTVKVAQNLLGHIGSVINRVCYNPDPNPHIFLPPSLSNGLESA